MYRFISGTDKIIDQQSSRIARERFWRNTKNLGFSGFASSLMKYKSSLLGARKMHIPKDKKFFRKGLFYIVSPESSYLTFFLGLGLKSSIFRNIRIFLFWKNIRNFDFLKELICFCFPSLGLKNVSGYPIFYYLPL